MQILNIINFMVNYKILMYFLIDLEYIDYINYNSIYFLVIFLYLIIILKKKIKKEKVIKNIIFLHYLSIPFVLLLVQILLLLLSYLLCIFFKKDLNVILKLIYKNILKNFKKFIIIKIQKI